MSAVLQLPIIKEIKKAVSEKKINTPVPVAQAAAQQTMKTSTRDERGVAAQRRARRAGRRALLSGGRLGSGEGGQSTLGAE
jgi:hypothetical protein